MTSDDPLRVRRSRDLGKADRWIDMLLGIAAILPLIGCAGLSLVRPDIQPSWMRTVAVVWGACLLAFFAGVRRGLTFSEHEGGRVGELITMLGFFALAVATLLLRSPTLGAIGFSCVGVLDALAARRGEAPGYFILFRPVQMALGAAALIAVQFSAPSR